MIVDKYLNIKLQPSSNVTKNWSKEMMNYFKKSWEADKEKERDKSLDDMEGLVEDVLDDDNEAVKNLVADELKGTKFQVFSVIETHVKAPKLSKMILCFIENIQNHERIYYSFIYVDNKGMDKRILWRDLQIAKCATNGHAWVLMGDFNVTLKPDEHSARSSVISGDMQEFIDCVNAIEVEDICSTGMHYTWIKSPSSPATSVMKKLDRKKSFKFANFIADKKEFIPLVTKCWFDDIDGFHMLKLVKKLKGLKKHFKDLQWKNRDLFERVEKLRSKLKEAQMNINKFPFDSKIKELAVITLEEFNEAITDEENHFEKFLGQAKNVQQLDSLGNIFSKSLTDDEVVAMVSDVSDHEIKSDMFSIEDCKSPGPDGFIACFFNKAWSVVGNDVCLAVKEFFNSGKLLREINSTLISLIPKVHHPKVVTEFRPIACCNVLYKCISKVLTNRIKGSLNKLVNLNQSAFIEGRNIQDNILLTHELLKGYNRKGGSKRCALKIDIAKAYDMIKGYFRGGRGLRQGDPISPYLFTLVMEVFTLIMAQNAANSPVFKFYPGCKDLKITYLCFVDDLLVIFHRSVESVKVIKESIEDFSRVSGLEPNLNKSTIFFGNVNASDQRSILNVLPFSVGKFHVKYLGVPLITKKLGRDECKQLIDRFKNKVDDWKNKFLTYAGRMQLIASVLNSMQVHWASVFFLPKSTVKDIKRILKGFLWCEGDLARGKAKITWKIVCKPKCKGGLGFKDLGKWNEVLLTKHIWNIAAHKESLWVKWVHIVKLKGKSFWEVNIKSNDSWIWKVLLNLGEKARHHIEYKVGNGRLISAWYDKWNKIWKDEWSSVFLDLNKIPIPTLSDSNDKAMWRCNNGVLKQFSAKQAWDDYSENYPEVNWKDLVWFSQCIPSHSFVLWMAQCMDSHDHIFVQCNYSLDVWRDIKDKGNINGLKQRWQDTFNSMSSNHCNTIQSVVSRIVFSVVIYFLWQERNKRQFTKDARSSAILAEIIMDSVKARLGGLKVKSSINVQNMAKE
ncbi:RNA-directed DNA polymerase, eukaryota, reverse transcriptase zinc-binding domain protein [Tanacetum coccineum]